MILSLENIQKIFNGNVLLDKISLTIEDNDKIGLVGVNGCGKTTLLNIVIGNEIPENLPEPFRPIISKNKNAAIGYLAQNAGLERENTIIDEMMSDFSELLQIKEEIHSLEHKMADENISSNPVEFNKISDEYARKLAYFEANDGYLIDVNINKILRGMNFLPDSYDRIISTLSGGEKTRLALAKLLLENPALLILDEPTNHLDFNTIIWLEDYLKDYKGALLVVSHDRYFLDKLTTSICEIESGKLNRYKGNYSAYTIQKEADVIRQMKEYEAYIAEKAKLQDFVDRNLVRASTSNMAKSRMKMIEALEVKEKPLTYTKTAKIKFEYDILPPTELLKVENIDISVGENADRTTLKENFSMEMRRGEKIGIIGSNGIGKSTLLKILQKKLPHDKGKINWTKNIKISYFDQENSQLNFNKTVIDEIQSRYRTMSDQAIRTLLGNVRLVGENVFKPINVISGGERAKLCFAIMMLERGNVLILDEPTNHLDIATREIIEQALFDFDGTIIFVSHDRYLLDKLATRIIEITKDEVISYFGGYKDYMEQKKQLQTAKEQQIYAEKQAKIFADKQQNVKSSSRNKKQRSEDAKKRLRIKELENLIASLEEESKLLEEEMLKPEICGDYILMQEKCNTFEAVKSQISEFTDEWIILSDEL